MISVCRASPTWRAQKNIRQKHQHLLGFTQWKRANKICAALGALVLVLSVIELQELQETSLSRQRYRIRYSTIRMQSAHHTQTHTHTQSENIKKNYK